MPADTNPNHSAVEVMARAYGQGLHSNPIWYWEPEYDKHTEAKEWREDDMRVAARALSALAAAGYEVRPADGVSIPLGVAKLIDRAFLPSNPNKLRSAVPEVKEAAAEFKRVLSAAEGGER